jgi:hypothetical protein
MFSRSSGDIPASLRSNKKLYQYGVGSSQSTVHGDYSRPSCSAIEFGLRRDCAAAGARWRLEKRIMTEITECPDGPKIPHPTPTYEIGYRRPPQASYFPRGKSGNPKGRPPRRPKSLFEALQEELAREHTVVVGGNTSTASGAQLVAKRLTLSACQSNLKAIKMLLETMVARQDGTGG